MPLHGELAVRLLDVLLGGVPVDAQYFVVVALRHVCSRTANGRRARAHRPPASIIADPRDQPAFLSFTSVNSASTTSLSPFFASPPPAAACSAWPACAFWLS